MRSLLACAALTAALLLTSTARAQTGTCSGMGLAASVGLAYKDSKGAWQTVAASQIPTAFGDAECQCPPTDDNAKLNLQIKVTGGLPIGTTGTAEVWIGSGCDSVTTRTQTGQVVCEKLATLEVSSFTANSGVGFDGILVPINGAAVSSPVLHKCSMNTTSTTIYVVLYSNPSTNFATCTLPLNQGGHPPDTVTAPTAGAGDGAVNLNWTNPSQSSTYYPLYYQILCADDCGQPVQETGSTPQYSACVDGVLHRRDLSGNSNIGGTGGSDGGVSQVDGGSSLIGGGGQSSIRLNPQAKPTPMNCAGPDGSSTVFPPVTVPPDMSSADMSSTDMSPGPDMSSTDMASLDMSTAEGSTTSRGPLGSLDPKYICGGTALGTTASSARITGLTNNIRYHFVIVSVDKYGNTSLSDAVDATPEPTEDLYRRYRGSGGSAASCFIATAAFGSYENRWVYVLRDFRDQVLLTSEWGRGFVDWYYAHSPPAASWIAEHGWARALVRALLVPVIAVAYVWVHFAAWQKALLLTLLLAFAFRKRIRAALARKEAA